jgi:shikimate dehydrogenase
MHTLTGAGKLAGVIGDPVSHSLSPRLHNYWLAQYGIDGAYVPLHVHEEHLEATLRLLPQIGFRGLNVTVPHKERVMQYVDELDARAERVGAVNTLVFEDSKIVGRNTDGFGLLEGLRDLSPATDLSQTTALVLGAGGASRAVCVALMDAGCPMILLSNRTRERAERLAEELGSQLMVIDWEAIPSMLSQVGLLINSTTLGMTGQPPLTIDLSPMPDQGIVYDIVYKPLETALLRAASARGLLAVDGLQMLIHQARPGFAAWFGVEPIVTPELRRHLVG